MREITLDSLTDEQLGDEERLLIDMLRTKYPKLDLRRGTVLRDLLVDADAAVGAMFAAQADEQRLSSSLLALSERAAAGEEIDSDDVNAILSNFNMESITGTKARGYVRVYVSSDSLHTVLAGVVFRTTTTGVRFTVLSDTTASMNPSASQVKQHQGISNYWYLVPVEAEEVGSNGNIGQGTPLESDTPLADFVSASAFLTFSGGSDLEALDKTVDRIKTTLSVRGLTTTTGVESQLRDRFDLTDNQIVAVSLCGYGNAAQLRDKHNLFGVAVGGRVDAYVRNFTELPVAVLEARNGKLVDYDEQSGTGTFSIFISHKDDPVQEEDGTRRIIPGVPGLIAVYSVSDPDSSSLSSYLFEPEFSASVSDTWHDFLVTEHDVHETANTVWRDTTIIVSGVPVTEKEYKAKEKAFRVSVVALPAAEALQDYMDDGLVRNVGADFVVRGPMVVNMSVNAVVRHPASVAFDKDRAVSEICSYVNTTGFVGRITRSEISAILTGLGATSVDLFDENDMLYGYVYDAFGKRHELRGDALDLDLIADPKAMLTRDTSVFVLEPKNVQITSILS